MRRSRILIILCLLGAIAALAWWLTPSSRYEEPSAERGELGSLPAAPAHPAVNTATGLSPPTEAERKNEVLKQVTQAYKTSITFYGRVIDQYGDPVPAAKVTYVAIDHFLSKGSDYTGYSDANGYFSMDGIKGVALTVGVWKEGYYGIDGKSAVTFAYGINPDSTRSLPPTKDKPAILLLHKMGATEPLTHLSARQYRLTRDGQPIDIRLDTGKQVPADKGDIRFERWANDQLKNVSGHFDWRFRITVPIGGLIERHDQFDFEAPHEGYQNVVEINMPASLGNRWRYTVNKSYFVKTRNGHYARVNVRIYGGHNNSLVLESFVNPNHNSRNLEFDPTKVVNLDH